MSYSTYLFSSVRKLSLIGLVASSCYAASWEGFAIPKPFYSATVANGFLFLATDGGIRIISRDGASENFTSEDGLEATKMRGVVSAPAGLYAVSEQGIIASLISSSKFKVLNRSFLESGDYLIPDLVRIQGTVMILGFAKKLAFVDLLTGKSIISLTRIGSTLLESTPVSAIEIKGDSLFVAIGNSVYVRKMSWESMAEDRLLADPASWTITKTVSNTDLSASISAMGFRGDSLVTRFSSGTLQFDSTKKETSACEGVCKIVLQGNTLDKAPLMKGDSSLVKWIFNEDGYSYLVGTDSAWVIDKGKITLVSNWTGYSLEELYALEPISTGGVLGYSNDGDMAWNLASSWGPVVSIPIGPYYGQENITHRSKNTALLPNGQSLMSYWGIGYWLYSQNGSVLDRRIDASVATCMDNYPAKFIASRGVTAAPDNSGFLVSFWSQPKYGIAFIDLTGEVSCANGVGSTHYSGPLRATLSEDGESWVLYSSAGESDGGVEGKGSLDVFTFPPPSKNGGQLLDVQRKTYPSTENGYLIDMDLDSQGRLWGVSYSSFGYWEAGLDSVQMPYKVSGYRRANHSSVKIDVQDRIWIGTIDQGVFMLTPTGKTADTLVAENFKMRNGLLSNLVYDIAIDPVQGAIWFAHGTGASRYLRKDLRNAAQFMTDSASYPVKIYPNPFLPKSMSVVVFDNISEDAILLIYNAGGHLVQSFQGNALLGGRCEWNGKDASGRLVAPGVYHYLIKKGKKKEMGKLLIIH